MSAAVIIYLADVIGNFQTIFNVTAVGLVVAIFLVDLLPLMAAIRIGKAIPDS